MTDAIPAKAGPLGGRAGKCLLAIGLILGGLPLAAFADGGTLRLSETKGPYRISVLTSPNPFRTGPVDISVIVADAVTGDVLPDVKVDLRSRRGQSSDVRHYPAIRGNAANKLLQSANFELPRAGLWNVQIEVDGPREPLKRASRSRLPTSYRAGSACGPGSVGRFSSSACSPFTRRLPSVGFPVGPGPNLAALIHLDMNEVRMTADRAVLCVFLAHPRRQIDRHDDFLAARIANVAGFFLHDRRFFFTRISGRRRCRTCSPTCQTRFPMSLSKRCCKRKRFGLNGSSPSATFRRPTSGTTSQRMSGSCCCGGAARLRFEEHVIELEPGDYVDIPAHKKHRVEWTTPDEPTVWLAVYYEEGRVAASGR